jgi:hypothetical protein
MRLFEEIYLREKYESTADILPVIEEFLSSIDESFFKKPIAQINSQFTSLLQERTRLDIRFVNSLENKTLGAVTHIDNENRRESGEYDIWVEIPYSKTLWKQLYKQFLRRDDQRDSDVYDYPLFDEIVDDLQGILDHELIHYQQCKKRTALGKEYTPTKSELRYQDAMSRAKDTFESDEFDFDTFMTKQKDFDRVYNSDVRELDAFAKQTARSILVAYKKGEIKGFNDRVFNEYSKYGSDELDQESYRRYAKRVYEFVNEFNVPRAEIKRRKRK